MNLPPTQRTRALTLIEVLIVVTVLAVLAAVYVTLLPAQAARSRRTQCQRNLKSIAIVFRIWAGDNGDRFPMSVSVTNGGTLEFVGTVETFRHFQVMSNELATPGILICPADLQRPAAASFRSYFANTNLSYFVGVDAHELLPLTFLSGDRNLTNGASVSRGLRELTTNQPVGWSAELHMQFGNILLSDGSVHGLQSPSIRQGLMDSGFATNRLAMP